MLFECLILMDFCCCSLPVAPMNAPTSWQDFAVSGVQLPSGSAGCSPDEPMADTEHEAPLGTRCFVQGICPGEASPRQSSSEVGRRMAEGVNVCVGTGGN